MLAAQQNSMRQKVLLASHYIGIFMILIKSEITQKMFNASQGLNNPQPRALEAVVIVVRGQQHCTF